MTAALIFPHQLFQHNPILHKADKVYLIEDKLFFTQYNFHKTKLVIHRASMKYYKQLLQQQGYNAIYVEHSAADLELLFNEMRNLGVDTIKTIDPTDYLLKRRLNRWANKLSMKLEFIENANFLTSKTELEKRLKKNKKGYFMANFYKIQRKQLNILMEAGEPVGGQWSFDEDNRKKLPKSIKLPETISFKKSEFVEEALEYVSSHFNGNIGELKEFNYPVTHEEALQSLDDFLKNRMALFGDYEDAIAKDEGILFHSVLTPALNIGLLMPEQVLQRTFELHEKLQFPLNSLEGFVRQIIGWREFMRGIYELEGVFERTHNHFGHTRKIPVSFYNGTTGIEPIDVTIQKVLKTGYCHHIERLMILGNFMLLCEFDPDDIYQWFMELFVDAYDWVMVPNVYGMTQYADGGLITTKPYVSSSNYVIKMSNYKKGHWCEVWDGLYWNFIHKHQQEFSNNQRMSFMTGMLNRMNNEKLAGHLKNAKAFLESLNG